MRKSGRKIKHQHRSVPMILHREGEMKTIEVMAELATICASKFGVMQKMHFDKLVEICNIAKVAGQLKPGSTAHYQPELERILQSMHTRWQKHKRIGVNATERDRIPVLVALNDAYWKGQTTTFYNQCGAEVNLFYKEKQMLQPLADMEAA